MKYILMLFTLLFFSCGSGEINFPQFDSWDTMSTINAPAGRRNHSAITANNSLIIWGGENASEVFDTGGVYTP